MAISMPAREPLVWMSDTRKGTRARPVIFHYLRPDERFTICGRPAYVHGHRLDEAQAVTVHKAQQCRTCWGENQRFGPDDSAKGLVA